MIHRLTRTAALGVLAASLLTAPAQAFVDQICLELPSGSNTLKTRISSSCLSTSGQYKGEFSTDVDASTATITINGAFTPTNDFLIGSADCMGPQVLNQEAEAAGPRRYSVMINKRFAGVLDASKPIFGLRSASECFDENSEQSQPSPDRLTTYARSHFDDWIGPKRRVRGKPAQPQEPPVPPITGESVGELAAKLLGNHPEGTEGRQSATITISPAKWVRERHERSGWKDFLALQIEEHGYLDDSISGKRTFAAVKRNKRTGQWRTDGYWQQYMCARGERAGQWSAQPCP